MLKIICTDRDLQSTSEEMLRRIEEKTSFLKLYVILEFGQKILTIKKFSFQMSELLSFLEILRFEKLQNFETFMNLKNLES